MLKFILMVLAAAIASAGFGVIFQVRGRNILYAAVTGGIGYLVFLLALELNIGTVLASFFSSCAITTAAEILARKQKSPATVFLVAGLIPIVPGRGMYLSMFLALEGDLPAAASTCYQTLLEAGAIAIGVVTVSSFVRMATGWRRLRAGKSIRR